MREETDGADIIELHCNLDDMTPEAIGFAQEALMGGGARDVFTTPAGMKKSRPGVLLTCVCRPEDAEKLTRLIFLHTTTLGVRETVCKKHALACSVRVAATKFGDIRVKEARGYGVTRRKCEYEDAARSAREHGTSLETVCAEALRALSEQDARDDLSLRAATRADQA